MIISVVARFAKENDSALARYQGWRRALCDLRRDWAQGQRPGAAQLRDRLEGVAPEHRSAAIQDLIAEHLALSWSAGCGRRIEAYLGIWGTEFAELASSEVVPVDLVEDEFLARCQPPHGDTPDPAEEERRFQGRPDVIERLLRRRLGGGRYVKVRTSGRGATSEVSLALDRRLSRLVAIKEPRPDRTNGVMFRPFVDEARLCAELKHPGIVEVLDVHADNGEIPFFVMRWIEGRSLAENIHDYHHPPTDRTPGGERRDRRALLECFVSLCEAAAFAHAQGVVHRDLKPANVLVSERGQAVILDWGMALRLRSKVPASDRGVLESVAPGGTQIAGTPEYMAPEQVVGRADVRTDVFGLGATLYEILTGRPPHAWKSGVRPAQWSEIVRAAKIVPPRHVHPGIPRPIEAICLKALAPDPVERYPGAAVLGNEVRRWLSDKRVWVGGGPIRTRIGRWWNRLHYPNEARDS